MTSNLPALIAGISLLWIPACDQTNSEEPGASKEHSKTANTDRKQPYVDTKLVMSEDRKGGKLIKAVQASDAGSGKKLRIKGEYRVVLADRTPPLQVTILIVVVRPGKKPIVVNGTSAPVHEEKGRHLFDGVIGIPRRLYAQYKYEIHIMGARADEKSRLIMKRPFPVN